MAEASRDSAEHLDWVHTLKQGGALPVSNSKLCSHAWASAYGNNFSVRGPHFLESKAKVPGGEPLLQAIAVDVVKSSSKISNIMAHPRCRVRTALLAERALANVRAAADGAGVPPAEKPFIWAFNFQLPSKENHSIVMYYVNFHSPEKGSLMQRFLDGDDAFRNERLKLLTSIPQGPRLMKLLVSDVAQPCLIGKVATCTYTKEKEYMEVDMDVGSTVMGRTAFQICGGFSVHVAVEFAFVVEGRSKDELPERIVGSTRLANLDFSCATSLDFPLLGQELASRQKPKASYIKGLWKPWSKPAEDVDKEKLSDGKSLSS